MAGRLCTCAAAVNVHAGKSRRSNRLEVRVALFYDVEVAVHDSRREEVAGSFDKCLHLRESNCLGHRAAVGAI